jgi:hypothetical protein
MSTKYMVIIEGGIVQDLLSNDGTIPDWDRFDWDDFKDNPVEYWDSMGAEWQEFFKEAAPLAYADALAEVQETTEWEEQERRKDPFCDVEAS